MDELLEERVTSLERPSSNLLMYYVLISLFLGPFFLLMLIPLVFRYRTMRYRFDDQGVSMRWGVLFRKEISLTYARIQDIHLQSNVVERWLRLARVQVQTASGSASAEMTIEGLHEFEEVRDYLYTRMKSARHGSRGKSRTSLASTSDGSTGSETVVSGDLGELVAALQTTRDELAQVRRLLEGRAGVQTPAAVETTGADPIAAADSSVPVAVAVPVMGTSDESDS